MFRSLGLHYDAMEFLGRARGFRASLSVPALGALVDLEVGVGQATSRSAVVGGLLGHILDGPSAPRSERSHV